mmetsp:Transcript_4599/g.6634  ORF Transcript_4599/g.6634 Transcript_4599/m.6634 type:complete len:881 (-) Transcript_4599:31-2673(-)|eukprot:CAMPEP_0194224852 /NCGR_PEP_ID=MMETSP0156-20130528/38321_1 /TAXON_ID=33649 /ORGANISM="Thalassionema nitzschioides, Strain L26-B" /LENGTH=880 /DNA_ID=CAMNT_0038956577 /DNA_START=157 /DNA_END=2799 /DNA_ORIENTATION=-
MPNHHHRSGGLKQSNKKNKRSKASKRSLNRQAGGRVNVKASSSASAIQSESKAGRRHRTQQRREASRLAVLQKRRGIDGRGPPPRVVGIISLGHSQNIEGQLRDFATKNADDIFRNTSASVTAKYNVHKKDGILTFLTNSHAFAPHYKSSNDDSAVQAALDLCRVCDLILFVVDGDEVNPSDSIVGMNIGGGESVSSQRTQEWDHLISSRGDRILAAVKAQGLPTPITVLASTVERDGDHLTMKSVKSVRRAALKRHQDLKKYASRFATTEFGVDNGKVIEVDLTSLNDEDNIMEEEEEDSVLVPSSTSSAALIRTICTISGNAPKWVSEAQRPYILSDQYSYESSSEQLTLTGFIRGKVPWNVNSLVHVPNLGTFACQTVQKEVPPHYPKHLSGCTIPSTLEADPLKRESLNLFGTPDALEGEQNLVGFDETLEYEEEEKEEQARPAGWSDYQSSWLDAVDGMSMAEEEMDNGELAKELNQKKGSSSVADTMDLDDENFVSPEERQELIQQRRKNHKEDLEFPDEVDVPEDITTRDRFARYRSLKSFRKSFWDPKESLPESYGSIYHFKNFRATQRDVRADMKDTMEAANETQGNFWGASPSATLAQMRDEDDEEEDLLNGCAPSGSYVTICLESVSSKVFTCISEHGVISAVGLLPHENKACVLNMGLSQSNSCDQSEDIPVKSKDILTFRCGWRTWKGRAIFSQNNLNSDKHKFERFLPRDGAFFAGSVFGPVTYAPCPVLIFREQADRNIEFLAHGSILTADADRIVVKRIVLTGFPVRVHKRTATVKYMFYNPDDVRWFKPAGLMTKHGLNGHIIESVGEHGAMKCLFNAPIKQHDTVCLPLYKRIYPKFANSIPSSSDGATVKSVITKEALLVL